MAKDDDCGSDTRWVRLKDLVNNENIEDAIEPDQANEIEPKGVEPREVEPSSKGM